MSNQQPSSPGPIKTELVSFASALMFLTRLPMPTMAYRPELLGRSIIYFPLVGLIIACIGAAVFSLAGLIWPSSVAVALALTVIIISTGAFHEDGLADSADGIGGGWTTEDKLRIMKDSRIGTYGGLALVLSLLLKFSALSTMPPQSVPLALLCAHVLGRWSSLPLLHFCPYVGGGSGNPFVGTMTVPRLVIGTALGPGLIAIAAPQYAFLLIAVSLAVALLSGWYFRRALGGVTGDTLGATNQLTELAAYLTFCAILTA